MADETNETKTQEESKQVTEEKAAADASDTGAKKTRKKATTKPRSAPPTGQEESEASHRKEVANVSRRSSTDTVTKLAGGVVKVQH